ncbi:unnamed protein product [Anisakis simplex]|uniref:Ig-like domain-containing protein n=1 Tax=Anisakis simplex TaxID=6269 RepID=A0A0M3J1F7_ANISI|nr:unnamed protein product [Anisakis simplex]
MKVHENDDGNYTCEDSYGNIVETFRVTVSTNSEGLLNKTALFSSKVGIHDSAKPTMYKSMPSWLMEYFAMGCKHEKIKRLDALKPCESAVNRLRVWKKNGKVICVQRSVEDVCGLGEVANDEPIKKVLNVPFRQQ